jgi:cytochrome c oxidase subunit 2
MVVLMNPRIPPAGAAALVAMMFAIAATAGHSQTPRRVITVVAERFSFTPSEITIETGEEVELRLKSEDTAHGFRIPGVVNVTVPKRGYDPLAVTIGPLAAGRYPFECSRVCGAGHNFMRGMLIVRDKTPGIPR